MLKYSVHALGCKVSQIDALSAGAALAGEAVSDPAAAEVVLIQTCSVTDRADRDDRKLIRRLRRDSPSAVIVALGCLAQRDPEGLARMPEVDLVVGHDSRDRLVELLSEGRDGSADSKIARPASDGSGLQSRETLPGTAVVPPGHTRGFLKIQDGCERRCSFCIVPSLRGHERSTGLDDVETEIRRLGDLGIPEVVLAGVHLSNYGKESGTSLLELISRLEKAPPACRVRLSSLEPMEAGEELIDAVSLSRVVVPHLHLPLQSGSNSVLRRMRRGITRERYLDLCRRALRSSAGLHLATDLIAGFPGETDSEFAETLDLLAELPFGSLHVFPFSPRSGTHATALHAADPVPRHVINARAAILRARGEEKSRAFSMRFHGDRADVVSLQGGRGLTANYLDVRLAERAGGTVRAGQRFPARLVWDEASRGLEAIPLID